MNLVASPARAVVRCCPALVLFAFAGTASAATLLVPSQFPTIQGAISAAAPGDVVLVSPGTYAERINFLGKAITVRSAAGAAATTINGGGAGPVVSFVTGETAGARLEGFTITGGVVADADGAGVRITSASPVLEDCVITGNEVRAECDVVCIARGAGVAINGGSPEFLRVRVAGNTALAVSESGEVAGGGIWLGGGSLALTDSVLINNQALTGNGGGLALGPNTSVTITGTLFESNAARDGGALSSVSASVTIEGSDFVTNTSPDGTATAIYAAESTLFTMTTSSVTGNTTEFGGAPLYVLGGVASVSKSSFVDNVSNGSGGGIAAFNVILTVEDSVFTNNRGAGAYGGAIGVEAGTATIRGCTFEDNVMDGGYGGGVGIELGALTIENSTFRRNNALGGSGGGVSARGADVVLRDSLFEQNLADGGTGGALSAETTAQVTVDSCTFIGNRTPAGGATVLEATNSARVLMVNCLVRNNDGTGGAISVLRNAGVTIANSTLVNNQISPATITAVVNNSTAGVPARLTLVNTILRGETTNNRRTLVRAGTNSVLDVTFSNIQGGFAGTGNISADPLFVDPAGGDFGLQATSPCVDTGNTAGVPTGITLDLADNPRVSGVAVDMGALERVGVCRPDIDGDGVADINDFFAFLSLYASNDTRADFNNSGFVDVDDFFAFLTAYAAGC